MKLLYHATSPAHPVGRGGGYAGETFAALGSTGCWSAALRNLRNASEQSGSGEAEVLIHFPMSFRSDLNRRLLARTLNGPCKRHDGSLPSRCQSLIRGGDRGTYLLEARPRVSTSEDLVDALGFDLGQLRRISFVPYIQYCLCTYVRGN